MKNQRLALVCLPADTLDKGLRMKELGKIDVERAVRQHALYMKALKDFGYNLIINSANNNFPDSVFVEDPAIIMRDVLVVTRLRKKERQGEEAIIEKILKPFFSPSRTYRIEPPGFIEGGDVLVGDKELFIGISERTNEEGAEQLAKIAKDALGYETHAFKIPRHYLHMKGEATFHRTSSVVSGKIITAAEKIAGHFAKSGFRIIVTPDEERFGANCISEGSLILIHAGKNKTKKILENAGFQAIELELDEFEKIDGAMTCLSKLFFVSEKTA